jgi:acyl-homoserine-lactone acylase
MRHVARVPALAIAVALCALTTDGAAQSASPELWRQVEVIRTAYGVPHIRADNLQAAGYALAWVQAEDYGMRAAESLLRGSGRMGLVFGRDSIDTDFHARIARALAQQRFPQLHQDTRDFYNGFAIGLNRFITMHPADFPAGMPADFTGADALASELGEPDYAAARRFAARHRSRDGAAAPRTRGATPINHDVPAIESSMATRDDNDGSNAWALAPSRSRSGHAILLRNPHLNWNAGYYEVHLTVPGHFDFYGDFRISFAFAAVGGFNRSLGWATTDNSTQLSAIYAFDEDPVAPDRYLLDGTSHPLTRTVVPVEYRAGVGTATETREYWFTPFGPVIHRDRGKIYVIKTANDGEYRSGEQFLRMMHATSRAEWMDAIRLRAKDRSNLIYADQAGNIFYINNNPVPLLPHAPGGDTLAIDVHRTSDLWARFVPFDSLPQVLNPKGGYVHNENNSPHFTNFREPVDTTNRYASFMAPSLSLRAQLGAQLIGGDDTLSLDDVVRRKHSYRMLLADRVKPDLFTAIAATAPAGDTAIALALLLRWDNTAAPDSRGAVLFETWWQRYSQLTADAPRFARPWTASDPMRTPAGLAQPAKAAEAFGWAVADMMRRYHALDMAWGDVHRVRRGAIDVPVGGCNNTLGCFRTLDFARDPDGKRSANRGDAWVLAVEFGSTPRAYSVLAYGESNRPESPWFAAQAEIFARGELKPVAYTAADVEAQAVVRYRPGEPR